MIQVFQITCVKLATSVNEFIESFLSSLPATHDKVVDVQIVVVVVVVIVVVIIIVVVIVNVDRHVDG